jgi:2-amino-4-hydroxy-6-hydroxymethyldihydropteridine diphosphokinase
MNGDGFARHGGDKGAGSVLCWIGLGSNLGDRLGTLQRAVDSLQATPGIVVLNASNVYESAPWGYVEQPRFLNAVVRARTTLEPLQLLVRLQSIERQLGRQRRFRWGPREIDLDILYYGDRSLSRRGLTIPHPSIEQRPFVLFPLRDVSTDLRFTVVATIDRMIARLGADSSISRYEEGPGLLVR